jgi:hypothetical protein
MRQALRTLVVYASSAPAPALLGAVVARSIGPPNVLRRWPDYLLGRPPAIQPGRRVRRPCRPGSDNTGTGPPQRYLLRFRGWVRKAMSQIGEETP